VIFGLMAILFSMLMFNGEPMTGWVIVAIALFFAVAFFVTGRANMSTNVS